MEVAQSTLHDIHTTWYNEYLL